MSIERLEKAIQGYRDEFITACRLKGRLGKNQNLQDLDPEYVDRALRSIDENPGLNENWIRMIVANERRAEERQRIKEESIQAKKMDRFESMLPAEFQNMSMEKAPRPQRFRTLSTLFSNALLKPGECGVLLQGCESGTGKTACAWAILQDGLHSGFDTFEFIRTVSFFRLAKSKHMQADALEEFNNEFERIKDTELLVLDDLGSEVISPSSQEIAFELIDHRTQHHLFTVVTTNLTDEELQMHFAHNGKKVMRRLRQFFVLANFDQA